MRRRLGVAAGVGLTMSGILGWCPSLLCWTRCREGQLFLAVLVVVAAQRARRCLCLLRSRGPIDDALDVLLGAEFCSTAFRRRTLYAGRPDAVIAVARAPGGCGAGRRRAARGLVPQQPTTAIAAWRRWPGSTTVTGEREGKRVEGKPRKASTRRPWHRRRACGTARSTTRSSSARALSYQART